MFADEAYGPKDRTAEGELKRKITESTISIEPKHRKRFEVPNRLHVMFASNNDWVVPAGEYERRFVVGNVSDVHLQDQAWFGPLYKQLRDGGYEAMLYDLLQMDLGDWHPRRIVRTAALAEQQEESLDPFDEWWLELLQTGVLPGAHPSDPSCPVSNEYVMKITRKDPYGKVGDHRLTEKCKGSTTQRAYPRRGSSTRATPPSDGTSVNGDACPRVPSAGVAGRSRPFPNAEPSG